MKSTRKTERAVRELDVRPRPEVHRKTLSDLIEIHVAHRDGGSKARFWITLAHPALRGLAAVVLVIASLAALVYVQHFPAPAYAIEQTVEALRKTSIVHILGRDWDDRQIEIWSKVNPETGLIDHWHIRHIDEGLVIISTPQNTFSYDETANTVRIQDGPGVASIFRLGEFFAGMNSLAERFEGRITYSEVVDPGSAQQLLVLTMSAPQLEIRSLIDSETKLPISIDTVRGERLGAYDALKHATKIAYDDVPPAGLFDFTIPAGAAVTVETVEDPLGNLPLGVLRHCADVYLEALEEIAQPQGIPTNTQVYFVDQDFNLRKGGFVAARNDSNEVWTDEVGLMNSDHPNMALFEATSGKKQQIRLVQHRQISPGRFRLYWTPDTPLPPGQTRHLIWWVCDPQQLPEKTDGSGRAVRLSNNFGGEGIETFILVTPEEIVAYDYSRDCQSHQVVGGYHLYTWQKHLPKERFGNIVDVSLSHTGADYSAEYIEQNRGQVLIEIPETFELANIVIAISEPGLNEQHRVHKQGAYYERVLAHFLPFKHHPLIAQSDLTRNYGYPFRDNSLAYRFDGREIVHAGQYFSIRHPDLFKRQLARLEDFARVSNFRQFYRDNLPYYERQIELYRRMVPVRQMWTWLEAQFPNRHDCYKIVFSPLLGASHETCSFRKADFSETIMFVSGPGESADVNDPVEQGCLSRVVFTEIDHNYVNRVTKDHLDRVNDVFADLGAWNQQNGYQSAEMTFNEYMTWAVFVLYAYDAYDAYDAATIVQRSAMNTMVQRRRFVRFDEFARELLRLYRKRDEGQTSADLYPAILDWAQKVDAEPVSDAITRRQATEDVDFLVAQVLEKHPDPFTQISKEHFEAQVRALKDGFGAEMHTKDLSLSVARLLATIGDSHTRHRDLRWFRRYEREGGKVFPVRFRYQDGRMKVASWSPEIERTDLRKGDVVLSVNDEPMETILARYSAYVAAECDTMRHYTIEALFARYQWMLGDARDAYQLGIRRADGTVHEITLPAVAPWTAPNKETPAPPLFSHQFYHDNEVCLFQGQSFANNLCQRIEAATDASIAKMKERGTEVLIFDLRNNGGGNAALGTQLLRKVIDRPYGEFTPDPNAWHGTLVLLCDRWTASAASWLATFVKDHGIGLIAGEETGGAASFFGNLEGVILPHSRLACTVATRHFMRPAGYDDRRGLLPDLSLDVAGSDEVLVEAIYTHIRETKRHARN